MILTLGSSIWAASQSVETSGSSVGGVMYEYPQDEDEDAGKKAHNAGHDGLGLTIYAFFLGSTFSTGPPASRHAAKPPPICGTGFSPMSWAVFAASADRIPPAQ